MAAWMRASLWVAGLLTLYNYHADMANAADLWWGYILEQLHPWMDARPPTVIYEIKPI